MPDKPANPDPSIEASDALRLQPPPDKAEWNAICDELYRLAKEATNGWACYAKRDLEHRAIARLHRQIDQAGRPRSASLTATGEDHKT